MPKVKPLTAAQVKKTRWQKADDNFRWQIGGLLEKAGLTKAELGTMIGIKSEVTMRKRLEHPSTLSKCEERLLAGVFEEYDLKYDFTLGEGVTA